MDSLASHLHALHTVSHRLTPDVRLPFWFIFLSPLALMDVLLSSNPPDQLSHNASDVVRRILEWEEWRELSLRPGKESGGSPSQTRGIDPPAPCFRCAKKNRPGGPFATCAVFPEEFEGACCNCRYNNEVVPVPCTVLHLNHVRMGSDQNLREQGSLLAGLH